MNQVSTYDSLIPYPESATGYNLALSQNPIVCDAVGIPKLTTLDVTLWRKTGNDTMEVASGTFLKVIVYFPSSSREYKVTTGKVTASLASSDTIPKYVTSVKVEAGESSYDVHDIADMTIPVNKDGAEGRNGRLPVPYGEYSSTVTYTATDQIAPYVLHDGQYYVMNKTTSVRGLNPKTDYAANGQNATWILLEQYKAAFYEVIMAQLGLVGKAVFYNEYMYSQYGKNGTTAVTSEGKYGIPKDAGGSFDPNMLLNFLTGYFRCNNAEITGKVNATSGTFKNVKVLGSVSSPFTKPDDSFDVDLSDNIALISSGGGWLWSYSLPWDVSQTGRKICITNYRWGNSIAEGAASINAPSGKYFFEDGISKKRITINREVIELLGYGTQTTFYGWIVLARNNLMTKYGYGRRLNVLAYGRTNNYSMNASYYKTWDGKTIKMTKSGTGIYVITLPSGWFSNANDVFIQITPMAQRERMGVTVNSATQVTVSFAYASLRQYNVDWGVEYQLQYLNYDTDFFFMISNRNDFV